VPGPRQKQLRVQHYLPLGIYGIVSESGITVDSQAPSLAGDFEIYDRFTATEDSRRADVYYQGSLEASEGKIAEIKIPIKGSSTNAQYRVLVYAEGSGASAVYDSSLSAASVTRTVTTITSFSAPPTGEKRYHIKVEAHLDTGEILYVGRPRVRHG